MIEAPERTASRRVRARVLGGFEVVIDDRPMTLADWRRTSAERLVKLLLVTPGHHLAREAAAEVLWPGTSPGVGLARLRKALHFAGRALAGSDLLRQDRRQIRLEPGRLDLDLDELDAAVATIAARTRAAGSEPDAAVLRRVLSLGESDLLPDDPYEDWLVAPRERLRARWQHLALWAARRSAASGRLDDAHALIDRLLARDPTDEAAHRLAIGSFAAQGRHHAARRQYEACRTALRDHLDAEPSAATRAAFERCLEVAAHDGLAHRSEGLLVGRRGEMGRLEELLEHVESGRFGSVVLRGPAGIGKSRLLRELVALARGVGWLVMEWQAVESLRTSAFAPLRIGLGEALARPDVAAWDEPARSAIATILPDLDVGSTMTFGRRDALVAGLVHALERLAGDRPLLLAWDDLPFLDTASLDLLAAVVASSGRRPLLVAATLRDEEPAPMAVEALIEQIRRVGGLDLALGPLDARDVEPLVLTHLGGQGLAEGLGSVLFERSAGNPLFCLELFRAGQDDGTVRLEGGRWTLGPDAALDDVPATVQRLVERRSRRLPGTARDALAAAAELPPPMTFELLMRVLGMDATRLLSALDDALASGLLVERPDGYAFAHPLFRLAVRRSVGARRAPIHIAIAEALADVRRDDDPARLFDAVLACADPVAVAEHAATAHDLGSAEAATLAVASGLAAGHRQRELFDNAAADAILSRTLAMWETLPPGVASRLDASAAFAELGDLRASNGDVEAATVAYRRAIGVARDPDELGRAYIASSWLPYQHGDFDRGLAILEEALEVLPADALVARSNVRREIGWTLLRWRRFDDAQEPLEDSLDTLAAAGDRVGAMRCLDSLGVLLRATARIDPSLDRLERSLAIALELGHARGEAFARIHLVASLTRAGRFLLARHHLERALELVRLMGDRYVESVADWMGAELEDAMGDASGAAAYRRHELALLGEIGGNPHNQARAHAHLAVLARAAGDERTERREARAARRAARSSREPTDPGWIEWLLRVRRWSESGIS